METKIKESHNIRMLCFVGPIVFFSGLGAFIGLKFIYGDGFSFKTYMIDSVAFSFVMLVIFWPLFHRMLYGHAVDPVSK